MAQSFNTRWWRFAFNHWPCYRRTGGRVTHIEADWSRIRVRLPLNWRTRNYMGTIFGGSMFGAVDPFFMMMLIKTLGEDYLVWDKAGSIRFKKPGRTTLFAHFVLDSDEPERIRAELGAKKSLDRTYTLELKDKEGVVHAIVKKTMYIALKNPDPQGQEGE